MTDAARLDARPPSTGERLASLVLVPAIAGLGFTAFLGERLDYLGHFLAGFGASLLGTWMVARVTSGAPWSVLVATLSWIGAGGVLESSVFALAGFDEVDFGVQSAGAVLAGL